MLRLKTVKFVGRVGACPIARRHVMASCGMTFLAKRNKSDKAKKEKTEGPQICDKREMCMPEEKCKGKFKSMWEPPDDLPPKYPFDIPLKKECCEDYCVKPFPRFDEMYYHPSCKCREYQTTWAECPKLRIRPRKVCCYEKLATSTRHVRKPKRPKESAPKTACKQESKRDACPRFPMENCIPGRIPPKCNKFRRKECCPKLCAPTPSWSECQKPELAYIPQRPRECFCLQVPPVCEVHSQERRLKKSKNKPKT